MHPWNILLLWLYRFHQCQGHDVSVWVQVLTTVHQRYVTSQRRPKTIVFCFLISLELSLVAKCNVHFIKRISRWKSVKMWEFWSQTSIRSDWGFQTPQTLPLDPPLLKRTMMKKSLVCKISSCRILTKSFCS